MSYMTKPMILIVEDDPILRDLTRRQLTVLGFESVIVGSGEEAVAEHQQQCLSLIFMDIGLPGMDGEQASMLIREKEMREQLKRVPIIALTAHSDPHRARAAGMDDFLQKPALLADIKKMLDKYMHSIR
jgi:CheY-like chemotaxis protein